MRLVLLLPFLVLVAPLGSPPAPAAAEAAPSTVDRSLPSIPFTDVTAPSGLDFVHRNAASAKKYLPETMGGGAAFFDLEGDGDPDLLLLHSDAAAAPAAVLYANDGGGRFRDVTAETDLDAALGAGFLAMGVAAADLDADGWTDLFVTGVGSHRLLWSREGRFVDGTKEAGLEWPERLERPKETPRETKTMEEPPADDDAGWSTGAAFFDADGDSDLDLVVVRYVEWSRRIDDERDFRLDGIGRAFGLPQDYRGSHLLLYRNRGDATFEEVGRQAGLHVTAPGTGEPLGKGLAVAVEDVDGDGRPDLFVANDTSRNFLFHNQGGGQFEEVGELFGVAYGPDGQSTGAMGVDWGFEEGAARRVGPGRLAFAVGNFSRETTSLYRAGDDPTLFADEAAAAGLAAGTRMALTFGVLFFDADLDGRLDLLQVNGHVEPDIAAADPAQSYRQAPQLFWNAGGEAARDGGNGGSDPAMGRGGSGSVDGTGGEAAGRAGRADGGTEAGRADGGAPRFRELPAARVGDLARPLAGRGAATADIDGDGDLDLLLTQVGGPARLLRNDRDSRHRALRLDLVGLPPNRGALGAHVTLEAGGRAQHRTVQPARGYLTSVEPTLTFGLGAAEKVDALTVTWPDGRRQRFPPPEPGSRTTLRQSAAERATTPSARSQAPSQEPGPPR